MILVIFSEAGAFAENKEVARRLRAKILRTLKTGENVVLDFADVAFATQSFIHALIAEAVRDDSLDALTLVEFHHCNDSVREIVEVVVSYCQDDWSAHDGVAADG